MVGNFDHLGSMGTEIRGLHDMQLILFGPPAAGKSTQAELISEEYGMPRISPGDILRGDVRKGTTPGIKAKGYMDKGLLVPDSLVIGLVRERLYASMARNGFVLDGFPRTMTQAIALGAILQGLDRTIDAVLNINVSDAEIIKRISGRRICPACNRVYNIYYDPPKVLGICDDDGSRLYQRADDAETVVRKRIEVYDERTKPLIEYYRKKGILADIDGDHDIGAVHSEIVNTLKKLAHGSVIH